MKISEIQSRIKPWMMPIAIVLGFLFHTRIAVVQWVVPYFIFTMLLLTFCRIEPRQLRFSPGMWMLLAFQLVGSVALYFVLNGLNHSIALAAMICVLCPVATAAPVVTGMLGGNVGKVAAFSVISNIEVAIFAPALFAWIEPRAGFSFWSEFVGIASKVIPVIIFPLLAAFLLRFFAPKVHRCLGGAAPVAFYLWSVSLIIVVGRSVSFIMAEPPSYWLVMVGMAIVSAAVCALQFYIGRKVGRRVGDPVTYGQSLGQKNTVLAIWMASVYLGGVCSVGPAAYVIWQNSFNSWQMYRKMNGHLGAKATANEHTLRSER